MMWKLRFLELDDNILLEINLTESPIPRTGEIVYFVSGKDYIVDKVYYEYDTNTIVVVVKR